MLADRGFPALKLEATINAKIAYFGLPRLLGGNVFSSGAGATESVALGVIDRANQLPLPVNGALPTRVPAILDGSR